MFSTTYYIAKEFTHRSSVRQARSQGGKPVSMRNIMTPAAHISTACPSKGSVFLMISEVM